MTNQELKRQTFLEATKRLEEKREKLYKEEPERKLYDEGKIGWNEYMEMYKKRKEVEREKYKDNQFYQDYDDGLITYDEFLALS
ncbi:hypothetical protein HV819_06470 [Anaerococcus sp. AGMB00486]|uniref:EF-hand domain-containing protein n=2 Tax=Anaerococcus TaxID=165779 RepID=A0ABX2NAD5_9FIRM|nr:hypothetical protein [Anaerococcus faecalis]NVF11628.1 hypothetical protein [Anaerococcus faecalis]